MLINLKQFVKEHQSDITLTIGIILVALISFGAGRLTTSQADEEPIVIEGPTLNTTNPSNLDTGQAASIEQSLLETEQGKFVGSVNSNKYHWPDCSWAKKIVPQNQIWFSSETEAQTAGYIRCSGFEKYIPVDYKP